MHYTQCLSTVVQYSMWAQRHIQILISTSLYALLTDFEVTAQYVYILCHSLEELSTKPSDTTVSFILAAFEEFSLKTPFRSVSFFFVAALMKAICQMFLLPVIKGDDSFTLHDQLRNLRYYKCTGTGLRSHPFKDQTTVSVQDLAG